MNCSDDLLVFAEENAEVSADSPDTWKILIVDDEQEVHHVTRLVLSGLSFAGRKLQFLSAYNAAQAVSILERQADIAVVLLDVVMETDDAGLRLVQHIRDGMGNQSVRIILRTGQPGQAPEAKVILEYDINDYKEKTELTAQKLYTTVITAIRSYKDIVTIEKSRRGLHTIIQASASIFELQSLKKFASGVLEQLIGLIFAGRDSLFAGQDGFTASRSGDGFVLLAGTGRYAQAVHKRLEDALPPGLLIRVLSVLEEGTSRFADKAYTAYIETKSGSQSLLHLDNCPDLTSLDIELVNIYCLNVAVAFENIHLNREIEDNHRELIFTLGDIVEQRSMDTGRHVKRVSEYARVLAGLCGLPEDEVRMVQVASAVHDIGKIAIPDILLNKASRLDEQEFKAMQEHAAIGANLLGFSRRDLFLAAATIARQHHERWDGQGYPAGLMGEDIHLYARITAIADVFDALSSQRVYRSAWSAREAVQYIQDQSGKQFDPLLVDLFMSKVDSFLDIQVSFP